MRQPGDLVASVVVPVRNGTNDVRELLATLREQTVSRDVFEVVVADDGSTDFSAEGLATNDDWVRVLPGPPLNSYAARNRAARASRGPVLAFCDADCRPEPDWLENGLAALEENDVAAGLIRFMAPNHRTIWTLMDVDTFLDQERAIRFGNAVTANLFVRRELYERIGGFDDSLPEHGDYDFVARCLSSGGRLTLARNAIVRHPTRDSGKQFLRKVWTMNRWYAARQVRSGRLPDGLKLRSWVPLVQPLRARRRSGRSLGLNRLRLEENSIYPSVSERVQALPIIYIVLPYLSGAAQLVGWRHGRRRR